MTTSMIEEIKVVVVGDGYTGKTTLCVVYKDGEYPQEPYVPTIFENYAATVTLNNRKYILNLFDSAGQEEYDQLRIMAYPNTNIFILCFSVVDPDSYSNILSKWIPELNRYAPRVPIVLVGTKLDLRNDPSTLDQLAEKNQRPISQSQGEYLAHVCSARVYLECSSMLNFNVRNVFEQAIDIHNSYEERCRHGLSNGRRILSDKLHSCSWFGTLFCCTTGSKKSHRKHNHDRYTVLQHAFARARLRLNSHSDIEQTEIDSHEPLSSSSVSPRTHHLNLSAKHLSDEELEKLTHDFTPFIFHQPFPIALVNRLPGHTDTANPQDAARLGAFRYAQKSIFIQAPTLNAKPAIDGIISACQRGIRVIVWIDLGFNDLTEGHGTLQGETNERIIKKQKNKMEQNIFLKFFGIQQKVAIMGNGNMDSQSWFHSQEINTMIDSPLIVEEWMDALYKNQSTHQYGKIDRDGIWRDDQGRLNQHDGKLYIGQWQIISNILLRSSAYEELINKRFYYEKNT